MEIIIRNAGQKDARAINDITNYYIENTAYSLSYDAGTLRSRKQWLANHLGRYPVVVAQMGDHVVGWASLSLFRGYEMNPGGYCKTVEDSIYLDHHHIGRGIGRPLLERLMQAGKEYGFHVAVSVITAGNDSSIILHEKLGFETKGVLNEVGYKNGQYLDVVFMTKIL